MAPASVDDLLTQNDVHSPECSIADALSEITTALQTHVAIRRFVRWHADALDPKPESPEPSRAPPNVIQFGAGDR
jgi:hypothetical protein